MVRSAPFQFAKHGRKCQHKFISSDPVLSAAVLQVRTFLWREKPSATSVSLSLLQLSLLDGASSTLHHISVSGLLQRRKENLLQGRRRTSPSPQI